MLPPAQNMPRFFAPLEAFVFNRFQARESYEDIEAFAMEEIVPLLKQKHDTLGLMIVPHARLIHADGYLAADIAVPLLQKGLMSVAYPTLATTAERHRAAWARSPFKLELIFGHRRYMALKWLASPDGQAALAKAGVKGYDMGFVPVDVRDADDEALLQQCVLENFARRDLTVLEEMRQIEMVQTYLGQVRFKPVTLADVAEFVGRSRSRVSNILALKEASDDLRTAVAEKVVTGAVAEELARLERMIPHINIEGWLQEPTPRQFLAEVTEGTRRVTRDQVRQYMDDLGRGRMNPVPEAWLSEPLEGVEGASVVSAKCGGCPVQVGGRCLNHPCWRTKRWLAGRKLAQELAPTRAMVGITAGEMDVTVLTVDLGKLLNIYLDHPEAERDTNIVVGVPAGYGVGLLVSTRQVEGLRPDYTDPAKSTLVYGYKGGVHGLKEKMAGLGILPEPEPEPTRGASADGGVASASNGEGTWAERAMQSAEAPRRLSRGQAAEIAWEGIDFFPYASMGKEIVDRLLGQVVEQLTADLSRHLFRSGSPVTLNWLDTLVRLSDMHTAEMVKLNPQGEWREELTRLVRHQIDKQLGKLGIGGGEDVGKVAYFLMGLHSIHLTSYDKAVLVIAQAPRSQWWASPKSTGRPYYAVQDGWLMDWGAELLSDNTLPESLRSDLCQVLAHYEMHPPKTLMEVFGELDGGSREEAPEVQETVFEPFPIFGMEPAAVVVEDAAVAVEESAEEAAVAAIAVEEDVVAAVEEELEEGVGEALSPSTIPLLGTVPHGEWLDAIEASTSRDIEELIAELEKQEPTKPEKSLPVYDRVPTHLGTKLKLRRLGRQTAEGQDPVGVYVDSGKTVYELYDVKAAVPLSKEMV